MPKPHPPTTPFRPRRQPRFSVIAAGVVVLLAALVPGVHRAATASSLPVPDRALFVGGVLGNRLSQITTSADGSLRPAAQFQVASSAGSFSVAISPDGRFVFAAGAISGDISVFARDDADRLTPVPGSPFRFGRPVAGLAVTTDGRRLVATSPVDNGEVFSLSISSQGALRMLGSAALLTGPSGVIGLPAVSPDGRYVFVASYLASRVRVFRLGADGALSRLGTAPTGLLPVSPIVTSDGRYLYTTNEGANTVSGFAVGTDGSLRRLPGSPYRSGVFPHGISIAPDGRFAYVPNLLSHDITGYAVEPNGQLTPLAGSPFPAGGAGAFPGRAVFSPNGRFLFEVEVGSFALGPTVGTARVRSYAVGPDGTLVERSSEPVSARVYFTDGPSSVLVPDQSPTARLVADTAGVTVTFDASASSDPDGRVAGYHWTFGDGTSASTTGPIVVHRYPAANTAYQASVRVTDAEGCSTGLVFNGQVTTCTGDPHARTSLLVRTR